MISAKLPVLKIRMPPIAERMCHGVRLFRSFWLALSEQVKDGKGYREAENVG
jgi:hypothetical protein